MQESRLHLKAGQISVTQLETFVRCPYQYMMGLTDNEPIAREEVLKVGTLFHLGMQSPALAALMARKSRLPIDDFHICNSLIKASQVYRENMQVKPDAYEVQVSAVILGVTVTGHIDEVYLEKDEDGNVVKAILVDNKSSKTKWADSDYADKLQKIFYPVLFYKETGLLDIDFVYRVFVKKKNITANDIIPIRETINIEEAEKKIQKAVHDYKEAIESNNFQCNRGDHCFKMCKYGRSGQCPAWKKKEEEEESVDLF